MKRALLFGAVLFVIAVGCARTWKYSKLEDYRPSELAPSPSTCQTCHTHEYDTWKRTKHANSALMSVVSIEGLRECGACHENASAHAEDRLSRARSFPGPDRCDLFFL